MVSSSREVVRGDAARLAEFVYFRDFYTVLPVHMAGRDMDRIAVCVMRRGRLRCLIVQTKQPAMRGAACTRRTFSSRDHSVYVF